MLALAVFPGWKQPLLVFGLFTVIEIVTFNLIEPWAYGARTGISPLAILLAAVFWTTLWGPVGLLLSTPLTVCVVVLGRHVPQLEFLYVLLRGRTGNAAGGSILPAASCHGITARRATVAIAIS